jgi:lambda repressor-like predicted transcriptional regulator
MVFFQKNILIPNVAEKNICFSSNWDKMRNLIEDLPDMLPVKVCFIWPSSFREEDFQNRPTRNKNCYLLDYQ